MPCRALQWTQHAATLAARTRGREAVHAPAGGERVPHGKGARWLFGITWASRNRRWDRGEPPAADIQSVCVGEGGSDCVNSKEVSCSLERVPGGRMVPTRRRGRGTIVDRQAKCSLLCISGAGSRGSARKGTPSSQTLICKERNGKNTAGHSNRKTGLVLTVRVGAHAAAWREGGGRQAGGEQPSRIKRHGRRSAGGHRQLPPPVLAINGGRGGTGKQLVHVLHGG